jgi:hypothetical protein
MGSDKIKTDDSEMTLKDYSNILDKLCELDKPKRQDQKYKSMIFNLTIAVISTIETKQDLQQIEIKKDKIVQELMHELEQKGLEQEKYKKRLNDLDQEANFLRNKLIELESDENNNFDIRHSLNNAKVENSVNVWASLLGAKDKSRLMNGGKLSPENKDAFKIGMQLGLIIEIGILTSAGINILGHIF